MVTLNYVVGLDLGPPGAFTAFSTIERTDDRAQAEPLFAVRHLKRYAPGTPFAAIAADVAASLVTKELGRAHLVVDITAVGANILEMFAVTTNQDLVPLVVTAGHRAEWGENGAWNVPKKELVTCLQILLQGRRLTIPKSLPEASLLARELANLRAKVSLSNDPLQAEWREGKDDDLVLAVALGCWQAGRMRTEPELPPLVIPRNNPLYGPLYHP